MDAAAMRGYDRYASQLRKEVLDYLALRQQLKEEKRKKLKKELGFADSGSCQKIKNLNSQPKDNYGSFFGASQTVIAERVIQESKSFLKNPDLAARVVKSNRSGNKSSLSSSSNSKSPANGQRSKGTTGMHKKVQMLKYSRDYSFLLSIDVELPAPEKERDPRRSPSQLHERSRDSISNNGRKVTAAGSRVQPEVGTQRLSSAYKHKHNRPSIDSRKQLAGSKKVNVPEKKKANLPDARTSTCVMHKPDASKSHPLVSKQLFDETRKPKVLSKLVIPPSKPKFTQIQPKSSASSNSVEDRPRKRPMRDDDDEDPISVIRNMFRYNPAKYADVDDDVDQMEANYDDIMKEEKRSSKIARKEDREELRKVEEEERRERLQKEAKKQKLRQP